MLGVNSRTKRSGTLGLETNDIMSGLASKTIDAIRDPDRWGDALDHIIANTPACAAIITLRDKKTCQIVNDADLERTYHSPLIRGFTMEAVVYYLTELRTIDPWAEYQRLHYPYRPTVMSRVCAPEDHGDQRFFGWLKSLSMEDTVVFELDRMAGYWTACNLFLPSRDREEGSELLSFAETHFDYLRNAWQTSQLLQHSRQTEAALLEHFGDGGKPCCLVGPNGELRQPNDLFQSLVNEDIVRLSGPNRKVSFSKGLKVSGLTAWEDHALTRHDGPISDCTFEACPIEPDPRFTGKREKLWLLTVSGYASNPSKAPVPFDLRALTPQETKLFRAVVQGNSVSAAGAAIGVRRTRAFEIWSSIKEKLKISNAHQVRREPAE